MAIWTVVVLAACCIGAFANPSPVCGNWTRTCQATKSGHWVTSALSFGVFSYPAGLYPATDYAGSLGQMILSHTVFNSSDTACATPLLQVTHEGQWQDQGPWQSSVRKLVLDGSRTLVTPLTADMVALLKLECPCMNADLWVQSQTRTLTICTDNCTLSGGNFSSIGTPKFGLARYNIPNSTLAFSDFTSGPITDNTTDLVFTNQSACVLPVQLNGSLCGSYASVCRAAPSGPYNVLTTLTLRGENVGSFLSTYDLFDPSDVTCSGTGLAASYHYSGMFSTHGPSDCDGDCVTGVQLEMFVSTASIMASTLDTLAQLNASCPCGSQWVQGQFRTILSCPAGTCTVYDQPFTRGLPLGGPFSAFGSLVRVGDNIAVTQFSVTPGDYSIAFNYSDYVLEAVGNTPGECEQTNTALCGVYNAPCAALASKLSNALVSMEFYGTDKVGAFSRTYRQYSEFDPFCVQPGMREVEYVLNGTYVVYGPSSCGGECNTNLTQYVELTVTRAQITPFNDLTATNLRAACKCGRTSWTANQPVVLTNCNGDCDLSSLPGVDGLVVGEVVPAYGSLARMGSSLSLTSLDPNAVLGNNLPFNTSSFILVRDPTSTCSAQPVQPTACGVYTDSCRAGTVATGGIDNDNILRSIALLGDQYGQIVYNTSVFINTDTDCVPDGVLATINASGTYALRGPSDCGGQCANLGAQKIEVSLAYTTITAHDDLYLTYLNAQCPCDGTWVADVPRTIADCSPGSCTVQLRGMPMLGSSVAAYGSILQFDKTVAITALNQSEAGWSLSFSSLDQLFVVSPGASNTACQVPAWTGYCGAYSTGCSGHSTNITSSFNAVETFTFNGGLSGAFRRTYKAYGLQQTNRCSGIVLQIWDISGEYDTIGETTCGGSCTNGSAIAATATSATVTLFSSADVDTFNLLCPCGFTWTVGVARTLQNCDICTLWSQAGAHGLSLGNVRYGVLLLGNGRLSISQFGATTQQFDLPLDPVSDLVYSAVSADSVGLQCAASAPSSGGGGGLSGGEGFLIAFFVVVGVYVIGGMAYNFRAGATGADLLPNSSFWRGFPGLVGDGFRFAFVDCFGLRGASAYSAL